MMNEKEKKLAELKSQLAEWKQIVEIYPESSHYKRNIKQIEDEIAEVSNSLFRKEKR